MKLSELITLTKSGSLSQTAVNQEDIILFTNLGIQAISDEFDLLSKNVIITVLDAITEYTLPLDFEMAYGITSPGEYWRDDKGKLTRQLNVPFEVGINVAGDYNSVFINNNLSLTVPYPLAGQPLNISYKVTPISVTDVDSLIPLASQYNIPLMLYVTYLGFNQALGSSHADTRTAKKDYLDSVDDIMESGTYINAYGYNNKFTTRGFV